MKDYLDGVDTLPEGPKKRMLDEYKEYLGGEKRAKRDVPEQAENEPEDELEAEEEGEEEGKEGNDEIGEREEGKGKGKKPKEKGKKTKSRVLIIPDTLESLQDFMFSKNKSEEE